MSIGNAVCSVGLSAIGAAMVHMEIGPSWPGWTAFTIGLLIGLHGIGVRSVT